MSGARAAFSVRPRLWSSRARHTVTALAIATLLAACEGGSSQSGSAFVFLSVDSFSLGGGTSTATVNSSIDTGTTTTACVTLRNNLKNPTVTVGTALDNVTVQSYTVTLTPVSGGGLPGPFTFGTAVLVPAGTVATGVISNNTATFPVILVPASAKLDPRVRPPNRLPIVATAEVTFKGRDGRGNSVQTEGAITVMFVTGSSDSEVNCTTTS
jgi:hypothetical protein